MDNENILKDLEKWLKEQQQYFGVIEAKKVLEKIQDLKQEDYILSDKEKLKELKKILKSEFLDNLLFDIAEHIYYLLKDY